MIFKKEKDMKKRTAYRTPETCHSGMSVSDCILACSIVSNSKVNSSGHEVGAIFDFSQEVDSGTGKTFSHEWETE